MSSASSSPAGRPRILRSVPAPINPDEVGTNAETDAEATTEVKKEVEVAKHRDDTVEELYIPTMGWPALWWKIKKSFNNNAKPPKPNAAEQALRDSQAENERQAQLKAEETIRLAKVEVQKIARRTASVEHMKRLSDRVPSLKVAFIGVKGGAATTTTMVNTTTELAETTRTTVYAADLNPASGSAGSRLGKNLGETISLREFGEVIDRLSHSGTLTKREVNARLRPTRYGVRVLIADDYTVQTTDEFGRKTKMILEVLEENCDYLHIDTANDITTDAQKDILNAADIFVFTANVDESDSLRLLYTSMQTVRQLGFAEKVVHSVVVISNLPAGDDVKNYSKYLNRVDLNHIVTLEVDPKEFQGAFLAVPHDPVIKPVNEVSPESYAWETRQAYIDVNNAIFEQALLASDILPS